MTFPTYIQISSTTLAEITETTVESWGLDPETVVTVFEDGVANADLQQDGVFYDIAAGNPTLTARLAAWFAQHPEMRDQ